ncbi:hypothetical protein GGI07_002697 [Coemansia sp. Benny D115]|nr:hypothetical protein GGI07_002697 [Coemansia sp. Benny D115]
MDSTIATSATAHQSHTTDARQDTGFWSECPSGSDSDTIDTERIIKSSGWLRSRLERCYREACGAADRDSGQGDVLDLGSLRVDERSDDPQMSCDAEFPDCRLDSRDSMLRWQPRFLEEHVPRATATTDGAAATNTAPHDMEIEEAEQEQEQEQQEQQHFYPLRRRSEKNLHPYTKLVWTNPAELRDARNKRRDLSLLDESQPIYAQDTFVQEESEDEDYVPGLNDPAELESQSIARVYLEPQLMPLLEEEENDDDDDNGDAHTIGPNATDSAISLSARRRVGGRTYRHLATQKKRARKGMRDISAFPSIEELLGAPAPNPIPVAENGDDPFDVPHAQMLQSERVPKTKLYSELSPSSDLDTADILLHGIVDTPSKTAHTLSQPDSPAITDGHTGRRRRLVSRKQPDHLSPTASPELLPTAKARKLDKISRHQIRGVLPFSFLRGFDKKKQSEIEEEVKRWEQQSPGSRSIRRRIRSSSPELQSDRDQNSPTHAEQFDQAPRKLFEFGFLDIYRWQFPELLMTKDGAGKGPDFLRLAARECNRQKNLYSADNPWRKIIKIEPRNSKEAEEEEEDVASSIVAAWRLGVIDIRRVYFCDDEDSDDQEYYENNRYPSDTLDVAGDNMEGNESAILISDDEAIEDNWGFDTVGGQIKTFGNATSRLPKNTKQKSSRSSRSSRSTRPSLLMDDHRPRDSYTLSLPKTQQPSGIRAIMGEFAAFDSDSDTDTRNLTHPLNLPRGSISKHLARKYEESNRRRDFVRRFKQWHRPTNRPIHQPRRSNTSDYPRENSRRPGVAHGEHVSAEYLFDNDPTLDTSQSSKHQQVSRKHKQTRLLLPLSGRGNENMSMDRVIERIGKTTPSRQISLVSKTSVGKQWRASGRSTRRKAMPPTRVQRLWFDSTKSGSSVRCPPSKPLAISGPKPVPALNSGQPFESRSDMLELEESDLLFGIGSGTQFRNDTWIGQGGIQRMRRLLYLDRQDVPEPDYSDTFHYNDVLSISISTATLEEFLQAFSMLCKLWCTKDITSESMAMSIFRWMEFCQRFISRQQYNNYEQNSSGICKVVNGVVGCVHEHLSEASPSVALVLAVSVMQVAREVTVWRSKKPHDAPKDSEDLLDQWTSERLASEIDNCVLVAAGSVLSVQQIDANFGLSLQPTLDLGFHAQCTVVLLHSLESISEYMTSIAPLSAAIFSTKASKYLAQYYGIGGRSSDQKHIAAK